jgi:hypothetical protein
MFLVNANYFMFRTSLAFSRKLYLHLPSLYYHLHLQKDPLLISINIAITDILIGYN